MKEVLLYFKKQYQKNIDNINWHIENNRHALTIDQIDIELARIGCYNEFIYDLDQILKRI